MICDDGKDNECDGFIDDKDPNCWNYVCPIYEEDELPGCITPICSKYGLKFFHNHTVCDDGEECTEDRCTSKGCRHKLYGPNIYLSPGVSTDECSALIENCTDSDEDGKLDYNAVNCTLGIDRCIKKKKDILDDELDQYKPKVNSLNMTFDDSEDIRNLTKFEVFKERKAKIKFDRLNLLVINNTGCFAPLHLDSLISIDDKIVNISTDIAPELNSSATLTFYNVAYDTPKLEKNGVLCREPDCVVVSYENQTLVVDVSAFSVYQVIGGSQLTVSYQNTGGGTPGGGSSFFDTSSEDADDPSEETKAKATAKEQIDQLIEDIPKGIKNLGVFEVVLIIMIVVLAGVIMVFIWRKRKSQEKIFLRSSR